MHAGDVLFVQPADDDQMEEKMQILKSASVVNWNRMTRMINLQVLHPLTTH